MKVLPSCESSAGGDASDLARRSFKYRASEKWNDLPLEIRNANKLNEFKRLLKNWVLENVNIK